MIKQILVGFTIAILLSVSTVFSLDFFFNFFHNKSVLYGAVVGYASGGFGLAVGFIISVLCIET